MASARSSRLPSSRISSRPRVEDRALVLHAQIVVANLQGGDVVAGSGERLVGAVNAAMVHHGRLHLVADPDPGLGAGPGEQPSIDALAAVSGWAGMGLNSRSWAYSAIALPARRP